MEQDLEGVVQREKKERNGKHKRSATGVQQKPRHATELHKRSVRRATKRRPPLLAATATTSPNE